MRILVTGGAGFIGSHIVDAYLKAGHEVAIADSLITGLRENINPEAKFYELDLRDKEQVKKMVNDFHPEVINHHAAHLSVSESVKDPIFDASVNIIGFLNLLEASKSGLKKIVVASSGGVIYGDTETIPTPDDHPKHPVSPYGVAKLTLENYLYFYQAEYGLDWAAMRYSNVYGPRQNPKGETGVIAVFLEKIATGHQPVIFGDGMQTRDYVFVSDVVAANMAATNQGSGGYNVGTGIETNVIEVFNELQRTMNSSFPEKHGEPRHGEQRRSALDTSKAHEELDWQPQVSFAEGVMKTVEWYQGTQGRR